MSLVWSTFQEIILNFRLPSDASFEEFKGIACEIGWMQAIIARTPSAENIIFWRESKKG